MYTDYNGGVGVSISIILFILSVGTVDTDCMYPSTLVDVIDR